MLRYTITFVTMAWTSKAVGILVGEGSLPTPVVVL